MENMEQEKKGHNGNGFKKGHKSGMTGKFHSKETKEKMGLSSKNRVFSNESKEKMRLSHIGKKISGNRKIGWKHSLKIRKATSQRMKGDKTHLWKGGITPINTAIRMSLEYRLWREAVFERDNYTCIWCGERGGKLNADHIKSFALFPELRFAIDNGRTLCVPCHKTTETYLKNNKKQNGK